MTIRILKLILASTPWTQLMSFSLRLLCYLDTLTVPFIQCYRCGKQYIYACSRSSAPILFFKTLLPLPTSDLSLQKASQTLPRILQCILLYDLSYQTWRKQNAFKVTEMLLSFLKYLPLFIPYHSCLSAYLTYIFAEY